MWKFSKQFAAAGGRRLRGRHCRSGLGRDQLDPLEARLLLAAAVVNWNDVRQTIDGFGASSAWMSGTFSQATLDLLYSTTADAGLSLLRTRVTPYVGSTENQIALQAQAYGVTVWSTPWTMPREFKTNTDT